MESIEDNGRMDICMPGRSVQFVVKLDLYKEGYKKMNERGITIRVITEITEDNYEYIYQMIQQKIVDEIRILKKVYCGIAVSKKQYIAAFPNEGFFHNSNERLFDTTIYHTEEEIIKFNQSIFDTLWGNAITIFKK